MFREMRRKRQELGTEECSSILRGGTSGVLAVYGDGGYPYAVPVSYLYDEGGHAIFIHSALSGHKLDGIRGNEKVSFCVIDEDRVVPEKYTTYFRSVIVFGRARVIDEPTEREESLRKLATKYSPDDESGVDQEVESSLARVCMVWIDIDHMSGKEAIEFVRARVARAEHEAGEK